MICGTHEVNPVSLRVLVLYIPDMKLHLSSYSSFCFKSRFTYFLFKYMSVFASMYVFFFLKNNKRRIKYGMWNPIAVLLNDVLLAYYLCIHAVKLS